MNCPSSYSSLGTVASTPCRDGCWGRWPQTSHSVLRATSSSCTRLLAVAPNESPSARRDPCRIDVTAFRKESPAAILTEILSEGGAAMPKTYRDGDNATYYSTDLIVALEHVDEVERTLRDLGVGFGGIERSDLLGLALVPDIDDESAAEKV